jgi:hypothetical protein
MVLWLILGQIGCSTSNRERAGKVHSPHTNLAALKLNDGQKWVVAEPMMVHLRNLEREVQDFERTPGGDDAVLAREVQDNLGRLVTNCTMEGKAHDELHKWLMPFLALSAEYSKATDPPVQQQKRREIQESLQVFHLYFE